MQKMPAAPQFRPKTAILIAIAILLIAICQGVGRGWNATLAGQLPDLGQHAQGAGHGAGAAEPEVSGAVL